MEVWPDDSVANVAGRKILNHPAVQEKLRHLMDNGPWPNISQLQHLVLRLKQSGMRINPDKYRQTS